MLLPMGFKFYTRMPMGNTFDPIEFEANLMKHKRNMIILVNTAYFEECCFSNLAASNI